MSTVVPCTNKHSVTHPVSRRCGSDRDCHRHWSGKRSRPRPVASRCWSPGCTRQPGGSESPVSPWDWRQSAQRCPGATAERTSLQRTATVTVQFTAPTYHAMYKNGRHLDITSHIFLVGLICDTTDWHSGFRRIEASASRRSGHMGCSGSVLSCKWFCLTSLLSGLRNADVTAVEKGL